MKILKGVCVWLAQAALTMAAFCALTRSMWLPGPWYDIFAWGLMPLLGAVSAYFATRHGVNNYLAWLAPPLCAYLAHYIVTTYAPSDAGPTLLTAFLSIIGAAAGHVRNEQTK